MKPIVVIIVVAILVIFVLIILNQKKGRDVPQERRQDVPKRKPGPTRTLIFSDNFKSYVRGTSYGFFSPTSNDATVTNNPTSGGLTFNATPQAFVSTVPQGPLATLDHVKDLEYSAGGDAVVPGAGYKMFTAPTNGEWLILKASGVGADQYFSQPLPTAVAQAVRDQYKDPRPCCATFAILDPVNLITCDFLLTRERGFAIYEHLPFLKPGWPIPPIYQGPNLVQAGDYHGFTHAVPIYERDQTIAPMNEKLDLEFRYNRLGGVFEWWINGVKRLSWSRIGAGMERQYRALDHNGPDTRFEPEGFCAGFGLFSLLDCHETSEDIRLDPAPVQLCTPEIEYVNPKSELMWPYGVAEMDTSFLDMSSLIGNRLFGQGAQLTVSTLSVYHGI